MGGLVHFYLPDSVKDESLWGQEQYVRTFVGKVRAQAEKKNIPVPKRISYGGGWGSFHVSFTTNQLRDLLLKMGKRRGYKQVKWHTYRNGKLYNFGHDELLTL